MYDFRKDADETAQASYPKPHVLLTASEVARLPVEYGWSWLLDKVVPVRSVAAGRPVLVLPGFYATDGMTARLRSHLRAHGYQVHGWGLGRNVGLTDPILDGLLARVDELHGRYGEPVSVIGWSFGGLLARWLAHERPDAVRQVLCLGSPWRAEGERTRATAMFERAAARHGLSERARDVVDVLRRPLPVPCTAIYSRTDGITSWRSCLLDEDGERCENIAVPSSHVGLTSNPITLAVVVDRLAQEPDDITPFDWAVCLRRSVRARIGRRSRPIAAEVGLAS
jgi:pimeloyl-ACP methyl ester carboxylesterase